MENITAAGLWAWLLAVALAIDTLGRAAERIVKARKAAKAPNDQQNERLDALEEWKAEVDRERTADRKHLRAIDEGSRVTQRALLALLDHGIDGNNITQMQHAKEELQEHLINR